MRPVHAIKGAIAVVWLCATVAIVGVAHADDAAASGTRLTSIPHEPLAPNPTGTALWRSAASAIPEYNPWDGVTFGTAGNTVSVGLWRIIAGAEAPTRDEIIAVGVAETNNIAGMIWDGTSWNALPFNDLATVTETFWWSFDVAYEQQSGDAVLVWDNGDGGAASLSYRVWDGSDWTDETAVTTPVAGEPMQMHLAANPRSDEMVLVVSNFNSQDYALVWDGSGWGNGQILDTSGTGDDRTDIAVAYEQQSNRSIVVYGKASDDIYYRIWDGTWGAEDTLLAPGGVSGKARWLSLGADPTSDYVMLGALTFNSETWLSIWEGTSWETPTIATNAATGTTFPNFGVAFEGQSGLGMAAYGVGDSVCYRTWMDGMGWSGELAAVDLGAAPNSMTLDPAPLSDHIMLAVQDGNNSLRYVSWDGASWGTPSEQETDTGESKNQPFIFLWDTERRAPRCHYVSPSGNDLADGLTLATAWVSIDNGDQTGVLIPGDTVKIVPGLYLVGYTISLTTSGTQDLPIVYTPYGEGEVKVRSVAGTGSVIEAQGNNIILEKLDLSADMLTGHVGITVDGDSCVVSGCVVHKVPSDGIEVNGDFTLALKNVVRSCSGSGIRNRVGAASSRYHANTVWNNGIHGIEIEGAGDLCRVFNNIVAENGMSGVFGPADAVCGFNDIWGNSGPGFSNGASDSAGGISQDPCFVNSSGGNLGLMPFSPARDAGLDLGYAFIGAAPEMGAIEFSPYEGTAYYVSPSGDDYDDGLSPATAWKSIDNGDKKGLMVPGDTVNIMAGTYSPASTLSLTTNGTSDQPITYRAYGSEAAIVDGGWQAHAVFAVSGDNAVVEELEVINSDHEGIYIYADSCRVSDCYIHDINWNAVTVEGSDNLILRNCAVTTGGSALLNGATGERNRFYHNTVVASLMKGVYIADGISSARLFNNIIASNDVGIYGSAGNVCAYNDVWGSSTADYQGGASDSAGGIADDPDFINAGSGDFRLMPTSPAIDRGYDLGYAYNGTAPDMGAFESRQPAAFHVSPTGDDEADGLSPVTAWLSIDSGDRRRILVPGDTVNIAPGIYTPGTNVWFTIPGISTMPVTYRKLGEGSAIIDLEGTAASVIWLDADYTTIDGLQLTGAGHNGIYMSADSCLITNCTIHSNAWDGIMLDGASGNLIYRNVVTLCGDDGIGAEAMASGNQMFHNTIHSCSADGIDVENATAGATLYNNIVTSNDRGIVGTAGNTCEFNDVWDNPSGHYVGGIADGGGGISEDPRYGDAGAGDFSLQSGSPAIDAGTDIGYPFKGTAPDMGAIEMPGGTVYYVSPTGDDSKTGLSVAQAWLSIDNGDQTGTLAPGDTVNILPGTYLPTTTFQLKTAGTATKPVVYRKLGDGSVIVDADGRSNVIIGIEGNHVRVDSLEVTNSSDQGVHIKSDSCIVRGLYVHDTGKEAFRIEGSYNLFLRNIAASTAQEGFKNEGGGHYNTYYGNTVYSNAQMGIELKENTARVFNNVVVLNDKGISGDAANVCAFNDVWGNTSGQYDSSAADSAGGISVDPQFADPAGGDFTPEYGSPVIDAGLDIGYPFFGDAPDMGAVETDYPAVVAYIEVDPQSQTIMEGTSQQVHAYGYEADSSFVKDLTDSVDWSVTDPSGSVSSEGLYTAGNGLSPPDYYVIATYAAMVDSGTVTVVTDGTLSYIVVELEDGRPAPDTTLTTDIDTTRLICRGYDSGDNPLGDQSVTWTVLGEDSIGVVSPVSGTSTVLELRRPGTGRIEATFSASVKDTSGVITCVAGEAAELVVTPDVATVSADNTLEFTCESFDMDGNATDPQVGVSWEVLGGIGTIDGTGRLTATTVGTGNVVASGSDLSDTTGTITVTPGILDSLAVEPQRDTISADSTRQFAASGFDGDGNAVTEVGNLTWMVIGDIGTIDAAGLFTAVRAGTGFIKVMSDLGPHAISDTIQVIPGAAAYIDVLPEANLMVEETSYQFFAYAYDADSNYVSDSTAEVDWTTTDEAGSVSATGLYTAGNDPSPPIYYLKVVLNSFRDSSEVTVLSSGTLRYVRIESAEGRVFGDTTLTTDDDMTEFHCRGYDSADSLLGDVPALWSVAGEDSIGSVLVGPASSTMLTLVRVGIGRIAAVYSTDITDTTGIITCLAGAPARVAISPDTLTLTAGDSAQFTTITLDGDDNPADPVTITVWEVVGGIGTISSSGLFSATTAGTGSIACRGQGLADTTGPIKVVADDLHRIEIVPDSTVVSLGGEADFTAEGFDAFDNSADVGNLTWDVIGGIGWIDQDGHFTAQAIGSGRIAVTSSVGGMSDTNRVVTVLPGDLALVVVTPDTATVKVSGEVQFSAHGFTADFQPANMGELTWDVLGEIGDIDASGRFVATAEGKGRIVVASSVEGVSDTTDMIVVGLPTISAVPLGDRVVYADGEMYPILAFRISNAFDGAERIEAITVRNASRGFGTHEQVLSNIDSIALFVDSDEDITFGPSDSSIASTGQVSSAVTLSFPPVTIKPGGNRTFFVSIKTGRFPHDGDSLDLVLVPGLDIETGDGTPVAGPDTINSLGFDIVDGLIAEQLELTAPDDSEIVSGVDISHVLTIDIPRNGYDQDILEICSVFNAGTADTVDIDTLLLYMDDGNGVWDGDPAEERLGRMSFTGEHWELSGISAQLGGSTTRFYLGLRISAYARNGVTLAFGIPIHGLEVSSANDGPVDVAVDPVAAVTVVTSETMTVRAVLVPAKTLIPGRNTGPVFGVEFSNGYAYPIGLDSLRLIFLGEDPAGATQADLDGQIDEVWLRLNVDGDYAVTGQEDSLVATGQIHDGTIVFPAQGIEIGASGGVVGLSVGCTLDGENSKNGNIINFAIPGAEDIALAAAVNILGDFPLKNEEEFVIDAFPASSVVVHPVTGITLFGGQTDQLMFDFELPGNGYADDRLATIRVANRGTVDALQALETVKLWADSGDDGFSGDDILLGELEPVAGCWEIADLAFPISNAGQRVLVTVDVANASFEGGSFSFEIPVGCIRYASGTDGPDDLPIGNPETHFLFPANSVTVIPIPNEPAVACPGETGAPLLTFALYNGYMGQNHILRGVRLSNTSRSLSSEDWADHELGQVTLYYDQNGNRSLDNDSLLATGYFSDGNLSLNGLRVELAAESLSYFFVTSDIPLDVIDSDTLAVTIEENSDFTFDQQVNINGDLPVSRGGDITLDGSVMSQYGLVSIPMRTLTPGDTAVTLFAFHPALNGDRSDVLRAVALVNEGDADADEVTNLRLWLDRNQDGEWQSTDSMLAYGIWLGETWQFSDIDLAVEHQSPVLLMTGDISAEAVPNASLRMVIPTGGCHYASQNDGPLDASLENNQTLVVSTSGLKVTYDALEPRYSVGEGFEVRVQVTNLLPVPLNGVSCQIAINGDPAAVRLDSTFAGPVTLSPEATADFYSAFTAKEPAEVSWRVQAFSATAETSAVVKTEPVIIQKVPAGIRVELISSIPTAVTRGQTQVFPASVRYRHSDAALLAASIRLESLRIRVENEMGGPLAANSVFSKVTLATGYTNLAIVESVPSDPTIVLDFDQPAILSPGQQRVLSIQVDIDSAAAPTSFALALESAGAVPSVDDNTGEDVPVDPMTVFPMRTPSCRINVASENLAVSYVSILEETANYGQEDVGILELVLRHPGDADQSQIQLTALSFEVVDASDSPIPASELLDDVKVLRHNTVVGRLTTFDADTTQLTTWFSAPPVLSPGEIDTLRIKASLGRESLHASFGIVMRDSTLFMLRDLSSGATVEATSDGGAPAGGPVFPIHSGITHLMQPATAPQICLADQLPGSIIAGSDSVAIVRLELYYPADSQHSSVRLDDMRFGLVDTLGTVLDPRRLFDRIGYRPEGGPPEYESSIDVRGTHTVLHLGPEGITVPAGESIVIDLVADIEPDAPFDHFIITMDEDYALTLVDATDRTSRPGYLEAAGCGNLFPFMTAPTEILLPAGVPTLRVELLPVALAFPGSENLTLLQADLVYNSGESQGDLVMTRWVGKTLRRAAAGYSSAAASEVFESVYLISDGQLVAVDTVLAGDTLALEVSDEYVVSHGETHEIRLACDVRPGAGVGNYVIEFGDSTFAEFIDRDMATVIHPALVGGAYPLRTAEVSVTGGDLANSFSNWPNPFNPGEGPTTIGFGLTEAASVDIEIFTITGALVKRVVVNSYRPAGTYREDVWRGLNDDGRTVLPGTYYCRINARYASGGSEELRRKVAVVR